MYYQDYHPLNFLEKQAMHPYATSILGGLGVVGLSGLGFNYYRKKRREQRNKERDQLWRAQIKELGELQNAN